MLALLFSFAFQQSLRASLAGHDRTLYQYDGLDQNLITARR
jgi:hypothetical protein